MNIYAPMVNTMKGCRRRHYQVSEFMLSNLPIKSILDLVINSWTYLFPVDG
jgi:hypothetical protein